MKLVVAFHADPCNLTLYVNDPSKSSSAADSSAGILHHELILVLVFYIML